jgi:hypothetical protein
MIDNFQEETQNFYNDFGCDMTHPSSETICPSGGMQRSMQMMLESGEEHLSLCGNMASTCWGLGAGMPRGMRMVAHELRDGKHNAMPSKGGSYWASRSKNSKRLLPQDFTPTDYSVICGRTKMCFDSVG